MSGTKKTKGNRPGRDTGNAAGACGTDGLLPFLRTDRDCAYNAGLERRTDK